MRSYYQDFPRVEYSTPFGAVLAVDLMTRFKLDDIVQNDPLATYTYVIEDGDRPDIIAKRYYGSADYAWVVMLSNDFFSVNDSFPLSDEQLQTYCETKYGAAINSPKHYIDPDGHIIDQETFLATPGSFIVTNYEFEQAENENKRNIRLISRAYLKQILESLDAILENINKAS